jgi:HK97 family phage portal protein
LKVYKDNTDGTREEARAHRCWRMLHDQPNPLQASHRFWATATVHFLLWGNVFIEKLRNEFGLVDELWLVKPWTVSIEWDSGLRRKRFIEESPDGRRVWTDEQMLHIPGFSTDGLVGRSPIGTAREALGTVLARERFESDFYGRGGVLPGVLKHPQKLSGEAQDRLKARFKTILQANEWAVLEEGMEANPLSMPLADMQFVESKQLSIRDCANLFNLPVSFLNGSSGDSLTYATVESNQIQFAQVTIAPIVNAIAKALTRDPSLFPQSVFLAEFVIDGIHRGDMHSRVEYYKTMTDMKAMTVNEVRAIENLPPIDGGDSIAPEPPPPPVMVPAQEEQANAVENP